MIRDLQQRPHALSARHVLFSAVATAAFAGIQPLGARRLAAQGTPPAGAASTVLQEAQAHIAAQRFAAADSLLERLVKEQPQNGGAWIALGAARRGLGRVDDAASALMQAKALGLRFPASRALFLLYANAKRLDSAAPWLDTLHEISRLQATPDLTSLATNSEVANLKGDARFSMLFPEGHTYDKPFVEDVKIIHEWRGEAAGDEFGWIARALPDVDGDKVMDVVVSATASPPLSNHAGKIYVYSGKSGKLLWKQQGPPRSGLGVGLESAGDVNGDGITDVIAGAPGANVAIVYSGRDGKELLRLRGDSSDVNLGARTSGIGDFNGDGRSDLIVGAFSANSARGQGIGRAIVFSGKDGSRLLTIDGERAGDGFGSAVGGGGGRFVVGAAGAGPNRTGRLYVYDRLSATPLFVKDADSTAGAFGGMFSNVVGDLDGDGVVDIFTTDFVNRAKGANTGRAYVYSGKTGAPLHTFTGDRSGEGLGAGAAYSGDVDGDKVPDLVIGSWQYSGAAWSGGRVQVFSGRSGRLLRTITGRVPGETLSFDAVGIGDVNGDGATDYLITSAWSMVNGMRSGRVFIVSGK
jgi:hypothetical protein